MDSLWCPSLRGGKLTAEKTPGLTELNAPRNSPTAQQTAMRYAKLQRLFIQSDPFLFLHFRIKRNPMKCRMKNTHALLSSIHESYLMYTICKKIIPFSPFLPSFQVAEELNEKSINMKVEQEIQDRIPDGNKRPVAELAHYSLRLSYKQAYLI